jgi:small subunit ribosomal protein S8
MAILDPIADMFTRIRNGILIKADEIIVPHSKIKFAILKILKDDGFIRYCEVVSSDSSHPSIKIGLKYSTEGRSVISEINRVSKSSRRVYVQKQRIPKVLNGFGTSILSTSKGILSGKSARQSNVGGELIGVVF